MSGSFITNHPPPWEPGQKLPGLSGLDLKGIGNILVQRQVLLKSGQWRTEMHDDTSSLQRVKGKKMQEYIRNDWRVENNCHWVMDTLFREDHHQTGKRNAAINLGTLLGIALNALKQATENGKRPSSLTQKQLRAAQDENYLEEVLSLVQGLWHS